MGIPKCSAKSLNAVAIERVIWEDIKEFCKSPHIAIDQLRAQRNPFDETLDDRIAEVDCQIAELDRKEKNLLKIAAESHEVSTQALDEVLREIRDSQETLYSYKKLLEGEKEKSITLEDDLLDVVERLTRLGSRIDQATFEERRHAVVELVKDILAQTENVDGKMVSVVTITYRFNEPYPMMTSPIPAVILDYTPKDSLLRPAGSWPGK